MNYTYSAEGYLLAKETTGAEGTARTRYTYDVPQENAQMLTETTGSDTTWYTYTYGQERIASYRQSDSGTERTSYLYDVQGSVIEMFTGDAESSQEKVRPAAEEYIEEYISKRYRCTPYGEQIVKEGETEEGGLQCNGEDYDRVIGLTYLRARWYNPKEARFFQPDIIRGDTGDPQSLNHYAFARNNPVMYADPSGEQYIDGVGMGSAEGFAAIGVVGRLASHTPGILQYSVQNPACRFRMPGAGL